jgi:hypothetical protein
MKSRSEIFNSTAGSISMLPGPVILYKLKNKAYLNELDTYLAECSRLTQKVKAEYSLIYALLDTADINYTEAEIIHAIGNFLVSQITKGIKIYALVIPQNITARLAMKNMLSVLIQPLNKNDILFLSQQDAIEAISKRIRHTASPTIL